MAAILLASSSMLAPKLLGLSAELVLTAPVAWMVEASGRMSLLLCKDLSPQAWVRSWAPSACVMPMHLVRCGEQSTMTSHKVGRMTSRLSSSNRCQRPCHTSQSRLHWPSPEPVAASQLGLQLEAPHRPSHPFEQMPWLQAGSCPVPWQSAARQCVRSAWCPRHEHCGS